MRRCWDSSGTDICDFIRKGVFAERKLRSSIMRIGIIGANGKQGQCLCREAMSRGHEVYAIVREDSVQEKVSGILRKSLFTLDKEDVQGMEVLISAFGSGFDVDPVINRQAIQYLIQLTAYSKVALQIVGGAGALYTDATHRTRVYELPDHPSFLRGISEQMTKGLEDLLASVGVTFTYVSPSLHFDYEGARTGAYQVGTKGEVLRNANGQSRISYADYALAMIDEAERGQYRGQWITVCEK